MSGDLISGVKRRRGRRRPRSRRTHGRDFQALRYPDDVGVRTRELVTAYAVALFVFAIALQTGNPYISLITYMACGWGLTRWTSKRLHWNWQLASVADIAIAKLLNMLAWPIKVPVLIAQVFLFRNL